MNSASSPLTICRGVGRSVVNPSQQSVTSSGTVMVEQTPVQRQNNLWWEERRERERKRKEGGGGGGGGGDR